MSAIVGSSGKLACRLVHRTLPAINATASRARNRRGEFSKYQIAANSNTQPNRCGRAYQCRFAVDSIGAANADATKKFPPTAQLSRNQSHVTAAIVRTNNQTTPGKPAFM